MLCRSWGIAVLAAVVGVLGCVDVPDSVRAQFAGPGAQDRTNYRPGNHGAEPPVAKVATNATSPTTTTTTSAEADAAPPVVEADGGAP